MVLENPFAAFRRECQDALEKTLKKLHPKAQIANYALARPPNPEFGQLASSLCFELAKQTGQMPNDLANQLAEAISKKDLTITDYVAPAGGYVNFHVDFAKFADLTADSIEHFDSEYGLAKTDKPLKIIVEHTSANPLHPIHIGQARNPVLGDTIARLLKARGHLVAIHYYIDDVGRQSSVIAYGYDKLGRPKPKGKPDHFLGIIYTVTSCLVEISRLRRELEHAKTVNAEEEIARAEKELDEWVAIAAELKQKHPALFDELLERIGKDEYPEASINSLNRSYEEGDEKARQLVRGVSELCFAGFKETLGRIGVSYDSWDWESDFVTGGHVAKVLQKLRESHFVFTKEGVLEFDAEKAIRDLGLQTRLSLRKTQDVPSLTLVRSDGTTLYTTRDVAYTLWKFEKADKVINVIGIEQSLSQLQLKIALHALGYVKQADGLVHFAYNLVSLPGYKMSSRRGHYITFDEVMDEAVNRAFEEVSKRSPELPDEEKHSIASFVGIGAVRYALVEVDPSKPVVFTWDRVLNFERNSAPYVQYTHARACSILRKASHKPTKPDYSLLTDELERELVLTLAGFPDAFVEASDYLKPNTIADYANGLADKFNTFYNALPVLRAETSEVSEARLVLVDAVRIVLRNAMSILGVLAPDKM